jgi:hypothetical protein
MSFHVPEAARMTDGPMATRPHDGQYGAHVSVRAFRGKQSRTPTWKEMAFVKDTCWDGEDVVVQYHPPKSEYVNAHPHVLHLWRHAAQPFPQPSPVLVGPLRVSAKR